LWTDGLGVVRTCRRITSPDADGLDAELCGINGALCWSDDKLINVLMIKLFLTVRIKPRVTLVAAQTETYHTHTYRQCITAVQTTGRLE